MFRYDEKEVRDKQALLDIAKQRLHLELEQHLAKKDLLEQEFIASPKSKTEQIDQALRQLKKNQVELDRQIQATRLSFQENALELDNLALKEQKLVVRSSIDGIVQTVNRTDSALAGTQTPIIRIISNEPYKVQGTLTEFDSVDVKPGQSVIIKAKALPSRSWKGTVESVGSTPAAASVSAKKKEAVTSYPFVVALTEQPQELLEGYHVSVEIQVKTKEHVLAIPHSATFVQDNKEYVFTVENHKLRKKEVTIGVMNDEMKEVLTGLREGEAAVRNPKSEWPDGMDVKTNAEAD